jgi:hypothetical protein|tara:strand:+ start:1013 stop:1162 length:150 start_codon:yes stop_codon:yes gene_type:complete
MEENAGKSLKPDASVLSANELEKIRWTGNSRWHRHTTSIDNKHQWRNAI